MILKRYLAVFFLSMVPVLELRGALILAATDRFFIPFELALPIAVIGNLIPVPFILFLFEKLLRFFSRRRWIGPILQRFWARAEAKAEKIGKAEFWGVFLFVAIPLPGTGAWTGALVASVLKMKRVKALLAISIGVVCAGLIVGALAYLLPDVFHVLFY